MAQLTDTEESPTKRIVAECLLLVAPVFFSADSNFQLVFCASIRYNFPVVDPFRKWLTAEERSKVVVLFLYEKLSAVS